MTLAPTTGGPSAASLQSYAKQVNDLMDSIAKTANDSGYNGTNLLSSGSSMSIKFNADGSSSHTVSGTDMSISGLGLSKFANTGAVSLSDLTGLTSKLDKASDAVRSFQGARSTDLSVIQGRQDFSKGMIDILDTGAANLVNADMNEEGAKLLALQTSDQLSRSALSLANQANQGILQLLR